MASRPGVPLDIPGVTDLVIIGRGGFGVVYRGHQTEFDRDVAVKVLRADGADQRSVERWRREVTAMGRLSNHPNIVAVYSAGVTRAGHPYLLMPFVGGGSLYDRVRSTGPLPAADAAHIGTRVASGLAAAHAAGVLHRDVKPANVLLSEYGEPQLTDFGIARLVDAATTSSTSVHATISYAAPEILAGEAVTPATDVYGLGATLHAALAARPPFMGPEDEPLAARIGRVMTQAPPDLRSYGVPPALAELVGRTLAKAPADRPASADELRRLLRRVDLGDGSSVGAPLAADEPAADEATAAFAREEVAGLVAPVAVSAPVSAPVANPEPPSPPAITTVASSGLGLDRPPAEPEPDPDPEPERRRRGFGWIAAAAALLALVGLAAWALTRGADDVATGDRSTTTEAADEPVTAATATASTPRTTPTTSAPAETPSTSTSTSAVPSTTTSTTSPTTEAPTTTAAPTTTTTEPPTTTTTAPPATAPPTTAAPPTQPPPTTVTTPPPDPAAPADEVIRDTISNYYASVPGGDLSASYQRLSEGYRARNSFSSYMRFWGGITSVRVLGQPEVDPASGRAEVTLRYAQTDGDTSTEVVELTFVDGGDGLLIDDYNYLRPG